jgi:hypothetical protein
MVAYFAVVVWQLMYMPHLSNEALTYHHVKIIYV